MTRHDELRGDEAFRKAVHTTRGVASVMYGTEMSMEEAEMLFSVALTTFANAGGLSEASLRRLARFAPDTASCDRNEQASARLN